MEKFRFPGPRLGDRLAPRHEATAGRARRHLFVIADRDGCTIVTDSGDMDVPARGAKLLDRFVEGRGCTGVGEPFYEGFGVFPAATATGADAELVGECLKACVAVLDGGPDLAVFDGFAYAYVHRGRILNEND